MFRKVMCCEAMTAVKVPYKVFESMFEFDDFQYSINKNEIDKYENDYGIEGIVAEDVFENCMEYALYTKRILTEVEYQEILDDMFNGQAEVLDIFPECCVYVRENHGKRFYGEIYAVITRLDKLAVCYKEEKRDKR